MDVSNSCKSKTKKLCTVNTMVKIGMLSAIAIVIMLFKLPLWFAPSFYELDFSEVPVLVGSFALGPVAGVMIELVKILLNLIINGTNTAGIGEASNFVIGCSLVLPASIIYAKHKKRKHAIIGLLIGILCMITVGSLMNAYVLLPAYATAFKMPIDALIAIGNKVNPSITSLSSFILLAVAPFNLLKGAAVSIITLLLYKRLSPIIKGKHC